MMQNRLEERWLALWKRMGAWDDSLPVFQRFVARYSESHRKYHTLAHIEHCLNEFEGAKHLATNPDAVELAIWFHDVIYDAKRDDNEERSIELFLLATAVPFSSNDLALSVKVEVIKLIRASKHLTIPTFPDAKLFVDIDLSIFGQSPEKFDEYEQQIREEYSWVPDRTFRAKRREILLRFLKRPRIFLTDHFYDRYETQAQENLARSVKNLSRR